MQTFRQRFISKCKELDIEPLQTILSQLSTDDKSCLRVTGLSLTSKTCSALAFALANENRCQKLVLSDCFLDDDGCIIIAHALKTNTSIEHLDLRGNNIRSDGAIALAQALKINKNLKSLSLEWNCIGIWEMGIQHIGDALSVNECLECLDLRNNKIGPKGMECLVVSLKHNTSLRRLDLRWNNAGLIGGRALLDMFTWNHVLYDMDLTGNEIPEDIMTAIDRNRESYHTHKATHEYKLELGSTVEAMTKSHLLEYSEMRKKLENSEKERNELFDKLTGVQVQVGTCNDIQRRLERRIEELEKENCEIEKKYRKENEEMCGKYEEMQRLLIHEREKRIETDEVHKKAMNDIIRQKLELEAQHQDSDLRVQVLKKDKSILLEELEKIKEREYRLNVSWEDKLKRLELSHQEKLEILETQKEKEVSSKTRRLEEKMRILDDERRHLEDELEQERNKWSVKRRGFDDKLAEVESNHRNQMELLRKDHEMQVASMRATIDSLRQELSLINQKHSQKLIEHEAHIQKRFHDEREGFSREASELRSKVKSLTKENEELLQSMNAMREKEKERDGALFNFNKEVKEMNEKNRKIHEEYKLRIQQLEDGLLSKDKIINELKDHIDRLELELDEKDREQLMMMKDLKSNINSLMERRSVRLQHERPRTQAM